MWTRSPARSGRCVADLVLAPLGRADLDAVAAVHARAFADSAITAFGSEAVRRYYLWLLEGPHDAALVGAWLDSRLVGFCAAGHFRGALNGFLRANRRYLALRIATHPWLLASPLIRDRLVRALAVTVRFSRLRKPAAAPAQPSFGVLAIATDPSVRGLGAGRALMLDAEARARARKLSRIVLTVHPDNARAIAFYEQLGWEHLSEPGAMEKRL